jgi:hypothetical protein
MQRQIQEETTMTKVAPALHPHFRPIQRLQLMTMPRHDAYEARGKPEPGVCEDCGVVWSKGHWHWGAAPAQTGRLLCPACRRIREHAPAGFLRLSGPALARDRAELLALLHNHAQRERDEHPLQRIMAVEDDGEAVVVTTTDIHLARGLGDALYAARRGELDYRYNDNEHLLYVHWQG